MILRYPHGKNHGYEKNRSASFVNSDLGIPALQLPLRGVLHHVRLHFLSHALETCDQKWSKPIKTRPLAIQKPPLKKKKKEKMRQSSRQINSHYPPRPKCYQMFGVKPRTVGRQKSPFLERWNPPVAEAETLPASGCGEAGSWHHVLRPILVRRYISYLRICMSTNTYKYIQIPSNTIKYHRITIQDVTRCIIQTQNIFSTPKKWRDPHRKRKGRGSNAL